jgi:hypothetical protein
MRVGMDPAIILIAAGSAVVALVLVVARWTGSGRRKRLGVVFELQLPSKWAAELTAQTLENDGIQSRVMRKGSHWKCYVTKPMGTDRGQIEATCRKLNQVAEARGGGCVAHRMKLGSREQVFEH